MEKKLQAMTRLLVESAEHQPGRVGKMELHGAQGTGLVPLMSRISASRDFWFTKSTATASNERGVSHAGQKHEPGNALLMLCTVSSMRFSSIYAIATSEAEQAAQRHRSTESNSRTSSGLRLSFLATLE